MENTLININNEIKEAIENHLYDTDPNQETYMQFDSTTEAEIGPNNNNPKSLYFVISPNPKHDIKSEIEQFNESAPILIPNLITLTKAISKANNQPEPQLIQIAINTTDIEYLEINITLTNA